MSLDYESYLSPFTWRYSSPEMRHIWSETNKRLQWRKLWVALAEVQSGFGLVQPAQVADLRAHMQEINIPRALEIETEIQHDLMSELKTFAEQAPLGGSILHLGATSMDIEDNADILRQRESLELILQKLGGLLHIFVEKIEAWSDIPLIAYTHIQPAEPSTLGYRMALYAQDLFSDWEILAGLLSQIKGKGFKGAVGTGAAYAELLGGEDKLAKFEHDLSETLGLDFYPVASQVYPRKQDYQILSALAGMGASLHKFAFDLRILQSPLFGEVSEPFGKKQVGSSAMPFKRNPVNAEKIDSLARSLAQIPRQAWDNAALSLLERTLDDSANRRTFMPEAFLTSDEILQVSNHILKNLVVNPLGMAKNLEIYGPFAASERLLMALSKAGADRQEMHEHLRTHAMQAWEAIQKGQPNPLTQRLVQDERIKQYLPSAEIQACMDASHYLGDAPQRGRTLAARIRSAIPR